MRAKIGLERHLRINHYLALVRQPYDQVGPLVGLAEQRLLFREIAVLQHAGELHNAAKLHLAPAAALNWGSERILQLIRRLPDPLLQLRQCAHLRGKVGVGAGAGYFNRLYLLFKTAQRLVDGLNEMLNLLPAAIEKELAVILQRIGSQPAKFLFQLLLRLGQQLELSLGGLSIFRVLSLLLNQRAPGVFQLRPQALRFLPRFGGCLTPALRF